MQNNIENPYFKSAYANVNDLSMYYEIHGEGYPLVLIHGGGSTIQTTFGRIIPFLAKNRKVIAVELQAHGRTADRITPSSFQRDADDVVALLKQLGIDKTDIFGFSNGGQTAMQIGMSYPVIVHKLIIASAFYKKDAAPEGFWEGMAHATFNDMPQPYKDAFLEVNNDADALMRMFTRDAYRMQTFRDWSDDDMRSITASSLILSGDKDLPSPEHSALMSSLIPDCHLAIIPGGHGTYLGELSTLKDGKWTQEFVVSLIEEFLDTK